MIKHLLIKVPPYVRRTILVGLVGSSGLSLTALAQDTNAPTKLKPTIVTGSLIPTAETVGPSPVETVSAAEIEKLGAQDVLDVVKKISTSFSGNGNVGQTVNNGGFGEANLLIRNLTSLVMLNGRRLGKSAFSNGQFVDLNTIPLSMIDRIEILKDGASALYGSEAVGGVINIITKKDFDGTEIGGRYGFATRKGNYTEERASVVSGVSTEHGSFVAGAQFYRSDPLLTPDRPLLGMGNAQREALGLAPASYISPSFPGKVQSGAGNGVRYLLANSPFLAGLSGYNPNLLGGPNGTSPGTPPVFPGQSFSGTTAVADYNAYAIAHGYSDPTGHGLGPYIQTSGAGAPSPVGAAQLNTTEFGTASILSQDRREVFASGNHDLWGKEVQLFGQFLFANTESVGQLAPAPVISLGPFDSNINVPADNIYNPFGIALGPDGSSSPRVRSRFVQSGNRIFDAQSDFYHFVAGLKGDFDGGYSYDAAYTYNRGDQIQFTRNAINGAALDLALQPNANPALAAAGFSRLRGGTGNFVPMYDIFFTPNEFPSRSGPNSPDTIRAISTSLFQTGRSDEWDVDGHLTGTPFDLPGGKLGFAVGGGFRSESLSIDFDGLTRIGKVPGLNAQQPTHGKRDSWAGFAEVRLPVTSPDMNIPGLYNLEVTAAGRYETFDPGGDSAVPKVTLRWQPLDEQFTLRGTYSQSFIAPTTFQLFGGGAQNNPFLSFPDEPNGFQATTLNVSNPNLTSVDAENYGAGIVISPKCIPNLTLSADYFHIKVKNDIFRLSEQSILNDLEKNGSASIYAPNFHFDNGDVLTSTVRDQITTANYGTMAVPYANGAQTETDGVDVGANYTLPLDRDKWGKVSLFANATVTFEYLYDDPTIHNNPNGLHGPYHYEGQYTDRLNGIGGGQGLIPDWQLTTGFTWDWHDFSYTVNARYIPEVTDLGDAHPAVGSVDENGKPFNGFTLDGKPWKIQSWFSIDMQLAYRFGPSSNKYLQGLRLAIGCNNITDEDPPIISSSFEDNTDKSTYDVIGRFVYFEVSKKF